MTHETMAVRSVVVETSGGRIVRAVQMDDSVTIACGIRIGTLETLRTGTTIPTEAIPELLKALGEL